MLRSDKIHTVKHRSSIDTCYYHEHRLKLKYWMPFGSSELSDAFKLLKDQCRLKKIEAFILLRSVSHSCHFNGNA